jgi:drug/metabolite transporter (DMT)-like permease
MGIKRSMIELHVAVIIMSATGLFAKWLTLPAWDIIALRCLIAALTLLAFIRFTGTRLALARRRDLAWIALLGLLIAMHWIAFFTSIQMSGVAIGLISVFTFPVMTILIEPFFFDEPLDRRDLVVALVVFIGVYLAIPGGLTGGQVTIGAAWGIFSALCYALRNALYRKYLSRYPSSTMMFYQVVVAAVLLLPFVSPGIDLGTDHRWLYLIVLGVIFTALPHTLFVDSLRTIRASTAGLITSLEPVYGIIFAAVLLAEIPGVQTIIGAMIVVAAATYTSLRVGRHGK